MLEQPGIPFIILAFVLAIGPLIFLHELGHYWVGRAFGTKIDAFSVGFGKELFGWTNKRGTRWKISALPLGGYVKFAGDENAASKPGAPTGDPDHFANKPLWQRFLIVLAGPLTNFIVAILIFAALFAFVGSRQDGPVIGQVQENSAAAAIGIEAGDTIVSIDNRSVTAFSDISRIVMLRPGEVVPIQIERGGAAMVLTGRIGETMSEDSYGQESRIGFLGVGPADSRYEKLAPAPAVKEGVRQTGALTVTIVDGLEQIVTGKRSVRELGGPIKMAQVSGQQLNLSVFAYIWLIGLLSINLGFINLLPIPTLDGGHLAMYVIEGVKRSPVSGRAQEWAFRGGLALVLGLMIFLTLNDTISIGLFDRLSGLIG